MFVYQSETSDQENQRGDKEGEGGEGTRRHLQERKEGEGSSGNNSPPTSVLQGQPFTAYLIQLSNINCEFFKTFSLIFFTITLMGKIGIGS